MKPKSVLLCDKPIADAVGLGLDVNEPTGIMIVDIGADTTEISVLSLGGLVLSDLLHFGGNRLDESIITYIKKNFNLVIGQKTAMQLKEHIGSALPGEEGSYTIVGLDVVSGLPIEMEITAETVYEAMKRQPELHLQCNQNDSREDSARTCKGYYPFRYLSDRRWFQYQRHGQIIYRYHQYQK